jgi:hypothetical protein
MSAILESGENRLRSAASHKPADQELRRRGYKIYARPNNLPAIWVKDGKFYCQVQAWCILLQQVSVKKIVQCSG